MLTLLGENPPNAQSSPAMGNGSCGGKRLKIRVEYRPLSLMIGLILATFRSAVVGAVSAVE